MPVCLLEPLTLMLEAADGQQEAEDGQQQKHRPIEPHRGRQIVPRNVDLH